MKFYRVCHLTDKDDSGEYHEGPYCSDLCPSGMAEDHCDDAHPSIWSEFSSYREYGCGFTSWEQYERWFSEEWRERLAYRDFVLRVFDLAQEDIQVGKFQSIARLAALSAEAAEVLPLVPQVAFA